MENLKWEVIKQNANCFTITKRNDVYVVYQMTHITGHHFTDSTMPIPDEHIDWFLDELEKRKQEKRDAKNCIILSIERKG